jgi:oligopeptide/dipeptide ABC transporter ATP-binding protein
MPAAGNPPEEASLLKGEVSTALDEAAGCAFAGRCPLADGVCRGEKPPMREIAPGRKIRCFKV